MRLPILSNGWNKSMLNGYNPDKLAAKEYQPLVADYLTFLETGRRHFSNSKIPTALRLEKLRLLEKALRKTCPLPQSLIAKLQQQFLQKNISISLLIEPLSVWRYIAADKTPTSGAQISEIFNRLMSPLARLILVSYDENPSTYLPLTSLFILLFLQENFEKNQDIIKKAKMSKRQKESRLKGLYKSAKVILSLVKSKRLKFMLALWLNKADLQTKQFINNKQHKPTFLDCTRIFLYSLWQFAVIKRKSVNNEGI